MSSPRLIMFDLVGTLYVGEQATPSAIDCLWIPLPHSRIFCERGLRRLNRCSFNDELAL
jgi:FMN phosphatase YigB (HAD superfamily)